MDILIVEDDPHKCDELEDFVKNEFSEVWVEKAVSVREAVTAIDLRRYDLILLDMALPSHSLKPGKGPPSSLLSGGLEIVHELDYAQRNDPIVILTQYHEIEIDEELIALKSVKKKLSSMFSVHLLDCIHYEMGSENWENQLRQVIRSK